MKLGHLIEYNMRSIFLKKSCTKCDAETNRRPFVTKLKVNLSVNQQPGFSYTLFLLHVLIQDYQNILKL